MDMDMDFLHYGLPHRPMITKKPEIRNQKSETNTNFPNSNFNKTLTTMLSRLNIASFEFISQQYDHIVQGSAVLGPLQGRGRVNADTSVIRPVLASKKGVVLSQALYPSYSEIDPYQMAAASIDTAIRNAVAAGASPDYLSLLDNFCWCSANDPERLYQLKQAAKACFDFAVAYGTPFISGKDSMFNDFKGFDKDGLPIKISIPPTLLISSFGVIDDITKVVSLDAKMPGDLVYLLGETLDEMGGSEYLPFNQNIPGVNAQKNRKLYLAVYAAIQKDLIASSISVRHGGLGVAIARKAIGGMLGVSVSLKNIISDVKNNDVALYSESQGRILATVAPANKETFEKVLQGNSYALIGEISKEPFISIKGLEGEEIINLSLAKAVEAYRETFKDY
jgi:phosphoribosylformylglycinamidine synthase